MAHSHNVYDTDAHFKIDPITRAIKNTNSKKTNLMQGDHNSERFTFELPRYIEGHDMSLCNQVEVHYLNVGKGKQNSGLYNVDDFQVSPEDENTVICSWLISKNATQLNGRSTFLLFFRCLEDGFETYGWHTDIYKGIYVSEGIDAAFNFETEYVDVIEQWKNELTAKLTGDISQWEAGTKVSLEESIDNKFNEHSTEWNTALAVERARIDQFKALKDGSTTGDAELQDIRIGANGVTYDNAGEAVRGQILTLMKNSEEMTYCVNELQLKGYYEPELTFENKRISSENGQILDSDIRVITNLIYCPFGATVDIKCEAGYSVSNVGNYDVYGNYLGNSVNFSGMIFRRYVIGKSNNTETITPAEALSNVTATITLSRLMNENRLKSVLNNYAGVKIGKNLLNRNRSEIGYISDFYGTIKRPEGTNYRTSEFIPLDSGASITISPRIRKLLMYDEAFLPISESYVDAELENYTYTATEKGFVRFTYYNSDDNAQAEYGTNATEYEDYSQELKPEVKISHTHLNSVSILNNKTGLSFGDSIMYGAGSGGVGILDILNELYSVNVNDYSVSGASAEKIEGRNFIGDQIARAISDGVAPDFILLDGLSNDIVHGVIGEISTNFNYQANGYSTFANGLEYCIGLIKDAFPLVPVVYVIPHSSAGRNYENELSFGNIARDICKKWSVPVADVYCNGNMTARIEKQMQAFTNYPTETTGTHPNKAGYEHAYIPLITSILETILK